ncbi:hypothetical protein HNQ50_002385 [Silvimonas terrae]|uniref:Antibiotic biosynthesis monooxygenase n=1 Tax=Silvimonas terrae TaxID=300266 RepID=A0A840REA1_9NEIS|nr:antibiotic biosynthesis monooxygenase [Silvimonas terrae]MBB5191655.1 hypothetical protein [Silvimonas terrae]
MTSSTVAKPDIPAATQGAVFRVDQFVVPNAVLPAFMKQVRRIDALLHEMPGCEQNLVLTRAHDADTTRVLTLVQWQSQTAMVVARDFVQQIYAAEGFAPPAFIQQLGVVADFGVFGVA